MEEYKITSEGRQGTNYRIIIDELGESIELKETSWSSSSEKTMKKEWKGESKHGMETWKESSSGYSSTSWEDQGLFYESKERHQQDARKWGSS